MARHSPTLLVQLALVCTVSVRQVAGTFTIGGADNSTGQVGGAGSTCIEETGFSAFETFYFSVPGKSVLLAQGYYLERNDTLSTAGELMAIEELPKVVLETITTPEVDPFVVEFDETTSYPARDLRQYGLVDVLGRPASYTGIALEPVYELLGFMPSSQMDQQGGFDSFSFAAQGNVVSEPTVSILASTFQEKDACDLAQRLMNAITAVHAAGVGDTRCANGVGSVAFLHVDAANEQEVIHIDVIFQDEEGFDPFDALKDSFDEWRGNNPCPEADVGAGDATSTAYAFGLHSALVTATGILLLASI